MKIASKLTSQTTKYALKALGALRTFAILGTVTLLNGLLLQRFDLPRGVTEMYILGVLLVSLSTSGYTWGIIASVASVLCINFFFTVPILGFNFTSKGYPITFLVLLTVSILTSTLAGRLKLQHELERQRTSLAGERQRILVESEKEKTRSNLLRAISHDLRTPLTGILGASAALLDNAGRIQPEATRELLTGIHDDADWLLRMVENVLSVTRISGGSPALHTIPEPLDELFSLVATKVRKRYPALRLSMRMPEAVTFVLVDQMLIVQVLVNLIDNAVRHSGSNEVELCAEVSGSFVHISVIDHGHGLPQGDLNGLFEGLALRDHSANDSTRGLGIGLSICRTIVECHDGHITASNRPEGGACIRFTLPTEEVDSYGEP